MDVVSYAKAAAVDKRLTDTINAGQTLSSWTADRDAINAKLADQNKQSATLENGTSVINGTLDSPVDVQVKGRTLVSMGSSVLQNGKQLVLADKKTKIRTLGSNGSQIQGVSKFVQSIPTTDTSNFSGKVVNSTVENPHKLGFHLNQTAISSPSTFTEEGTQSRYNSVITQDGVVEAQSVTGSGYIGQRLFSFDIVSEVERKLGRIPRGPLADKISWLVANLSNISVKWVGYGSGPNGNKATLGAWNGSNWVGVGSHTSPSPAVITWNSNSSSGWLGQIPGQGAGIDVNGFFNFVAWADASDGTTASVINTDYIEITITLNANAQLDNRPILSRIANFDGKIFGSTVEVPHISYRNAGGANATNLNTLVTPSNYLTVLGELRSTSDYTAIGKNDGSVMGTSAVGNGNFAQMAFQFDIIQEIERQLGRIPKATLADKAQWCIDNINLISFNWYGYGSGPNGYKAITELWYTDTNNWYSQRFGSNWMTSTSSSTILLGSAISSLSNKIDSNGFVNLMVRSDAAAPVANPTVAPTLSASGSGSGLAAGTYYVTYVWATSVGSTLPAPEASITITAGQNIVVQMPSIPFGVASSNVYMSTTSGTETYQGWTGTTTNPTYTRASALAAGGALPTTNTAIVASTINTDYVELQIELKQGAILHDPVVPLYQIDDVTEYTNILTTWNETEVLNRYPKVQAIQHVQNPYAMAEGENVLPPMTEWSQAFGLTATFSDPYNATLNASASAQVLYTTIYPVVGQTYTFSSNTADTGSGYVLEEYTAASSGWVKAWYTGKGPSTFTWTPTSPTNVLKVRTNNAVSIGVDYVYSQPMLTLGSTAKPFEPRNPSYLFATAKLGQIGTAKDVLYKQDGQWYVRQSIQKDVVIDSSLPMTLDADGTGQKNIKFTLTSPKLPLDDSNSKMVKFNGSVMKNTIGSMTVGGDYYRQNISDTTLIVSVWDTDSGFGETYAPIIDEWKAYFYGWQAKTVDANGKPTAWRSIGDGTDAPTQTLAYVSVTKAPNFTPYKLSYVLATPTVVSASVEGDIALNGPTQVQVGSGVIVREKVIPVLTSGSYYINGGTSSAKLANRVKKLINVYKNGILDTNNWTKNILSVALVSTYGNEYYSIPQANFDVTADYKVTYMLFDTDNTLASFTNNPLEVITNYDNSIKSVVDDLVEKQSDLMTTTSVNVQAIAELYKRVKALGG